MRHKENVIRPRKDSRGVRLFIRADGDSSASGRKPSF
jgi:hypothetical protein